MTLVRTLLLTLAVCATAVSCSPNVQETLSHGRFKNFEVYRPTGPVRQVVLLLSGDGGWADDTDRMAVQLQKHGALVVGIDQPALLQNLLQDRSPCYFPDGDLENLSHFVQAYYHLPTYIAPVLAGYSAGSSMAYVIGGNAAPGLFSAVLTLGFTPDYESTKPFCKGEGTYFQRRPDGKGLTLLPVEKTPLKWIDVHGQDDSVCPVKDAAPFISKVKTARIEIIPHVEHDFAEPKQWSANLTSALDELTAGQVVRVQVPEALKDLPLLEIAATGTPASDAFAIMISGDGGWAGIDKGVAKSLSARGVPIVGWDSLRYFWTKRTPDGVAQDLDRVIGYYTHAWHRQKVLLVGYSQGADVLPFAINRLSPANKAAVSSIALLGLGHNAAFEFHLSNWVGPSDGLPIKPEFDQLPRASTLCVYGLGDKDSLCADEAGSHPGVVRLGAGHHFGGDFDGLADLVLKSAGHEPAAPAAVPTSAPESAPAAAPAGTSAPAGSAPASTPAAAAAAGPAKP